METLSFVIDVFLWSIGFFVFSMVMGYLAYLITELLSKML